MLHTRIYNTFINDFLQGNVPETFSCSAYIVNSKYADMPDTKYYLKHINDFSILSANSLYKDDATGFVKGDFISTGVYLQNTYYRDENINEDTSEDSPLIVCNDNLSAFSAKLLTEGQLNSKYQDYIDKFGFFYFVTKNNSFAELTKQCKNKEHFAVVLGDDIDNVVVNGNAFGNTRQHPFRGVFDGNGYTVSISQINATTESNGLFGYIAEDGVVKNVTVCNSVLDDSITVNSTVELNIDMIKGGIGDIRYGILAGTNYGTISDVILSGGILYDGCLRPAFYFTENKSSYDKLYSTQWTSLYARYPNEAIANVTAISDVTNICYPTQLCANSDANIVPYIGYFCEGIFNKAFVSPATVLKTPLSTTMVVWPGNVGNNGHYTYNYTNYMYDIYTLYTEKHQPTTSNPYFYEDDYVKRTVPGSNTLMNHLPEISFRLGPNDKAAYLIGNLVGFNGGTIASAAVITTATFNTTTVALIGGLAGRDAGGKILDTYVCTTFLGSSGMYTEKVTVEANDRTFDKISATINAGELLEYDNYTIQARNPDNTVVDATLTRDAILSVLQSFNTVYTATVDDIIGSLYSNDSLNSAIVKMGDAYRVHFSGSTIPDNLTTTATVNGTSTTINVIIQDISIYPAMIEITGSNGYENVGELMTTQHNYSGVSAVTSTSVEFVNPNFTASYPDIMPSAVMSYNVPYTSTEGEAKSAFFTKSIKIPEGAIIKFNAHVNYGKIGLPISTKYYDAAGTTPYQIYRNNFDIMLYPIVNIGGMFGEYVYTDGQSIDNSRAELYAANFSVNGLTPQAGENSASYVSNLSVISLFASNITFDSSLKSNTDFYNDSLIASSYSKLQNNLNCTVQTLDANTLTSHYIKQCDAIIQNGSKVGYAHYLNCYNQIAPALVTTNGSRVYHHKAETHYPDIGIQYVDQLFYEVGLNMGVSEDAVSLSMDEYNEWSRHYKNRYTNYGRNVPLSGLYFNYPAQVSSCDANGQTQLNKYINAHNSEYNMWYYPRVFDTAFNIHGNHTESTAHSTMYVSKQLDRYPTHYPLYRSRMSLTEDGEYYGASVSTKLADYITVTTTVPVKTSTYKAANPEFGEASKLILDAVNSIAAENSKNNLDESIINYTYTYSSKPIETGAIKPVEMNMQYSDCILTSCSSQVHTAIINAPSWNEYIANFAYELTRANEKLAQYKIDQQQRGYLMNSNSYLRVVDQTPPNVNIMCKTLSTKNTTVNIDDNFEEHEAVTDVINFNLRTSENCTLEIANNTPIAADLVNVENESIETVLNYYKAKVTDNIITLVQDPASTTAHEVDVTHRAQRKIHGTIPATATFINSMTFDVRPVTAEISINIDSVATLLGQRTFMLDNTRSLTANHLTYAFVPVSADIVDILNANAAQQFECTGLSADDMCYALIVDSAYKPIMDMQLTTTAVENDGYIIEFPSNVEYASLTNRIAHPPVYTLTYGPVPNSDHGVAINIENGNK